MGLARVYTNDKILSVQYQSPEESNEDPETLLVSDILDGRLPTQCECNGLLCSNLSSK
jgi:hypothetical protein